MINQVDLRRWATWLRANAHRQVRGRLRQVMPDGALHWCAIGGLEELRETGSKTLFSRRLEAECIEHVVWLNDRRGWTFPQIADWIDRIADGVLELHEALMVQAASDLPPRHRRRRPILTA